MKKISSVKSNQLLLKYILKSVLSTVLSLIVMIYLFTVIIYKLDLDLESAQILSVIICVLCSFIISFISVSGLKNNGLLMGLLATLPLVFYSIINLIFNENSLVFFIIKVAVILLVGALTGYISVNRKKKFKV